SSSSSLRPLKASLLLSRLLAGAQAGCYNGSQVPPPLSTREVIMDNNDRPQQQREAFLSLFLTGLGGFFFLVVLILISGGFFLWVLLVALGIGGVALLHYALWGRM